MAGIGYEDWTEAEQLSYWFSQWSNVSRSRCEWFGSQVQPLAKYLEDVHNQFSVKLWNHISAFRKQTIRSNVYIDNMLNTTWPWSNWPTPVTPEGDCYIIDAEGKLKECGT